MIIECQNCGAPLDVGSNRNFVECRYCQRRNRVNETKTLMQVTPADWQAPAQWSQADRDATRKAIALAAGGTAISTGASGCIFVVIASVVVLAMAGAAAFTMTGDGGSSPGNFPMGPALAPAWNGMSPFSCGGNDSVTIDGVTANLPNDVAITASINCTLIIRNSNITARVGIEGRGNGEIRLQNSTIEGTQAGARVSGNRSLILDNSDVHSQGVGIDARGNAQIRLQAGKVQGSPAVTTSNNAQLENVGGVVVDL